MLKNIIFGTAMEGYWLLIENVERATLELLSTVSQIIFTVRRAIVENKKSVEFGDGSFKVNPGVA